MDPILANWSKCSGRASTFAPQSIKSDTPVSVGIIGARGGLLIPLIRPTIVCPPTSTAPELPAETKASASFCFTIFIPITIDDCFFLRIACTGGSAISIISGASTISICSFGYSYLFNSSRTASSCPTRNTLISSLDKTASTAPLTISTGALSPPIASRATFVIVCMVCSSLCIY